MQKDLLDNLAGQLSALDKGGYARVYRRGGKEYPDQLTALVAGILDALKVEYRTNSSVSAGSRTRADFAVGDLLIFIGEGPSPGESRKLRQAGRRVVTLSQSGLRSDIFDSGLRLSEEGRGRLQTIFLDDPSFNFDYAHILPKTEKCSVMHGHTSSALVEVIGEPRDGMVVDFNDAKPVIRQAIAALDHKLLISEKYVTKRKKDSVSLTFETVHGPFQLTVPKQTTVLLEGEATVENLAQELIRRIAPRMPENVEAVGVYVYEGLNKGTHLLAMVHSREAERRRRP